MEENNLYHLEAIYHEPTEEHPQTSLYLKESEMSGIIQTLVEDTRKGETLVIVISVAN